MHDGTRQCAVSSCRAPSLPDTTPLDIDSERVEVDLCPYHAGCLVQALDALHEAAEEADEIELGADEDESEDDDELDRLRLIEVAAQAMVDLATTTQPAWVACTEYQALRVALEGAA